MNFKPCVKMNDCAKFAIYSRLETCFFKDLPDQGALRRFVCRLTTVRTLVE